MHPYTAKSVTCIGGCVLPICYRCFWCQAAAEVWAAQCPLAIQNHYTESAELHTDRAAPHGRSLTASETVEQPLHGSSVMTGKSSGPAALASKYSFRLQ